MDEERELEWVRTRLAALESIEDNLLEMRSIAQVARDHVLNEEQVGQLRLRMAELQRQIDALDAITAREEPGFE